MSGADKAKGAKPPAVAAGGVRKKKYSHNKKKNWRKFVDMKEIDEFMEDESLAHRMGGRVTDKTDEQLFVIDSKPKEIPVAAPVPKRKKREPKPLRIEKALNPNPQVKPVGPELKVPKKGDPATKKEKERREAAKKVAAPSAVMVGAKKDTNVRDVWTKEEQAEPIVPPNKLPAAKMPKTKTRPTTLLPAVEKAHPGQSYNPAFEDHQTALGSAVGHIEKEEKQLAHWKEKAGAIDKPIPYSQYTEEMKLRVDENGELILRSDDEEEDEEGEEGEEENESRAVRSEDRKTRVQRNKEKRLKEEETKKRAEKEGKVKENEIYNLRSIKRKLEEKEEVTSKKIERREERKKQKMYTAGRMSRFKFVEEPIAVQLTEDLAGSLRELKPEGSLMKDRFKSLQKRNLVEVRRKVKQHRRYKLKEYERRSYKSDPNQI